MTFWSSPNPMMQIRLRFASALQALFVAVSLLLASATQADFNPSSDYSDLSQRLTAVRTLTPDKRIDQMVQTIVLNRARESGCLQTPELALCVAPGTDEQTIQGILNRLPTPQLAYVGVTSWTSTATNSTITAGKPITITYSFLPDGTYVPGGSGATTEVGSPSALYSSFDAAFGGNRALWKAKFAEAFNQWGALTNITYVEVFDDGEYFPNSSGVLGSRGDVRIAAHNIDGAYNVLAYNYYPNNGDMVFDSSEAWGQGSNQLFFRNTCTHEHGHGLGLGHVWPLDHTKLMEPTLNTNFDGPQDDDIRGAVRSYDDYLESNSTPAAATDLGSPGSSGITKSNLATYGSADSDWFKLTAPPLSSLTVRVVPLGF
ncbi:MAG: matrixin family metalloprotease, partial [Armatimonadota bacterium]